MIRFPWKRPLSFVALTMCSLMCLGFSAPTSQAAPTNSDLRHFVGTWHAQFEGRIFLTLMLETGQNGLTGTISRSEFQVGKDGELVGAVQHDGSDPITEAKLDKGILRVTSKEEDSQDTIQFEMKLTGTDQAELRVLTPSGVTAPKPWKLERAKAH